MRNNIRQKEYKRNDDDDDDDEIMTRRFVNPQDHVITVYETKD
jgi:hypothetical protein